MPRVFPFEALLYDVAVVGALDRVTTPPYDVISEVRRHEYRSEPFSIVQVDLGTDDGERRYAEAEALLRRWVDEGVLVPAPPAFHAYEMRSSAAERVRGIFCAMELEDWGGDVMPHEQTMAGPVEDRLRLLRRRTPPLRRVRNRCRPVSLPRGSAGGRDGGPARRRVVDEQGVIHLRWTIIGDQPIGDGSRKSRS